MDRRQVELEMQRGIANASPLARTASHNITRAVEPCRDTLGWGVLALMAALVFVAGIRWAAEARNDIRATRRAVEVRPCR